ncbi:MAG: tyrosine-type recombinase/integrase [Gemmataceae bacterium]|nr:tyrosine-type recombinase/integrase [Gemmataceae bacterium]
MARQIRPRRKTVVRYYDADGRQVPKGAPGAKPRKEQSGTWYAKIDGRSVPLRTTDEGQAWQELRRLLRRRADEAAGIASPEQDDAARPLADHLADYLDHLKARGTGKRRYGHVRQMLTAVLDGGRLATWRDLDAGRVGALLARWRETPGKGRRPDEPMAPQTSNTYAAAVKAFAGWLARRLKVASPLAELTTVNPRVGRRHVRRTLTPDELGRLLAAAEQGPPIRRLSGPDRAVLYLVAAYTGLRAAALASLTPESLTLAGDPPTLRLDAAADKGGRARVWPVQADVAARLRAWLKDRPSGQKLWPGPWARDCAGAKMIRADLERAGIPYKDAQGRAFDFHALRGQFITGLALAGVSLVAAQRLAGHSSPTLTANFYSHLETEDLARELAKLPPPPQAGGDS